MRNPRWVPIDPVSRIPPFRWRWQQMNTTSPARHSQRLMLGSVPAAMMMLLSMATAQAQEGRDAAAMPYSIFPA